MSRRRWWRPLSWAAWPFSRPATLGADQTAPHVVALPRDPDSPVFAVPLPAGAVADPAAPPGTNVVRVGEDPAGTAVIGPV